MPNPFQELDEIGEFVFSDKNGNQGSFRVKTSSVLISMFIWENEEIQVPINKNGIVIGTENLVGFSTLSKYPNLDGEMGVIQVCNCINMTKMMRLHSNKDLNNEYERVKSLILERDDMKFKLIWEGKRNDAIKS